MSRKRGIVKNLLDYRAAIANLGFFQALFYKWQKLRSRWSKRGQHLRLYSRYSRFPLYFRTGTSDIDAFCQIFVAREYRCLDELSDASLIMDCGANVGYASAYFLSRFPNAHVIAVEPDRENFALMEKNLRPYKGRYRTICSAIWSRDAGLVFSEVPFGDGREWARTVREAKEGEDAVMVAHDIDTLFKESGFGRISVLKIDIEGSEAQVFSSAGYKTWINHVDNLVIELHGHECQAIFLKAISPEDFNVSKCDELTVCKRPPMGVAQFS